MPSYQLSTLENGVRVVTVDCPHLHGATVAVYVASGSRHETPATSGVSHFLEHLLFRGSRGYPDSLLLNSALEPVGGSVNGATTREHGFYYASVRPSGVPLALSVLGDMLAAPLFKEVDLEREVILEEILDEVDEEGRVVDLERLSKDALFGDHPMALPIAGTADSVNRLDEDALRTHHATYYRGPNLVVAVAGPLSHDAVLSAAAESFAGFPPGESRPPAPPPPLPTGPRLVHVRHRESQTDVQLTFPCVPEDHPDYPALIVLRRVLDDGLASRLQHRIVERRGLAYSVGAWVDPFRELGLFELEASAAHGKVPALLDALWETLSELKEAPPTDDEVARAHARYRFATEVLEDATSDLVAWYGEGVLLGPLFDPAERLERVEAVTPGDVQRAAQAVFRPEALTAVVVGLAKENAVRPVVDAWR